MLDPTTGAPLASFNLPVTGSRDEFGPYVIELETSADGRWLVIGGNFVDVAGQARHQLAVIDLGGATAAVADWSTDGYVNDCASVYDDTWIRGIDISPDSKYFVVNTTGAFFGNQSLCDTVLGGSCRRSCPALASSRRGSATRGATRTGPFISPMPPCISVAISGGRTTPTPALAGTMTARARLPVPASPPWTHTPVSRSRGTRPETAVVASRPLQTPRTTCSSAATPCSSTASSASASPSCRQRLPGRLPTRPR